jgi:RHS repeat-associated protein
VHDSERRLKSVSANAAPIASYGHDGLGRRIRKALPDGTHRKYVYDLDGRIIAERDELNQPVRETIFVDGHPVAEMVGAPGVTTVRYIHTDQIGLPRLMTDASGSVIWDSAFMPFGEQVSATGSTSTDHRFQGQLADTHASLYYNYFRDYDPALGRYIQSDSIGLQGGLNRFSYVGVSPLTRVDSNGLFFVVGAIVSGGLSAGGQFVGYLGANGGDIVGALKCINLTSVGTAAAVGVVLPGAGNVAGSVRNVITGVGSVRRAAASAVLAGAVGVPYKKLTGLTLPAWRPFHGECDKECKSDFAEFFADYVF